MGIKAAAENSGTLFLAMCQHQPPTGINTAEVAKLASAEKHMGQTANITEQKALKTHRQDVTCPKLARKLRSEILSVKIGMAAC
jgi:hypothetical protein